MVNCFCRKVYIPKQDSDISMVEVDGVTWNLLQTEEIKINNTESISYVTIMKVGGTY